MRITLTPGEYQHAAYAGFVRQAQNLCAGRVDAHGYRGAGYDIHIVGAVGEFVVARALGVFWAGPGTLRAPDVELGLLQVRSALRPDSRLIIHPSDPDDAPFVLVTGSGLVYDVRGWLMGHAAKDRRWWADPTGSRPAYFVPQGHLQPLTTLVEVAYAHQRD